MIRMLWTSFAEDGAVYEPCTETIVPSLIRLGSNSPYTIMAPPANLPLCASAHNNATYASTLLQSLRVRADAASNYISNSRFNAPSVTRACNPDGLQCLSSILGSAVGALLPTELPQCQGTR